MRGNDLCPCGSGKKFKHCCRKSAAPSIRALAAAPAQHTLDWRQALSRAIQAQQSGRLDEAADLCQSVLRIQPREFNALHILGGVRLLQGRVPDAARILLLALPLAPAGYGNLLNHLGFALAKLGEDENPASTPETGGGEPAHSRFFRSNSLAPLDSEHPPVSVILLHRDAPGDIEQSLNSIGAQTYPCIDRLVVIDNAGAGLANSVASASRAKGLPTEFISGAGQELGRTLNQAVALTGGRYLSLLDTGDRYAPDRIASLVSALHSSGSRWGFSNLHFFDASGKQISYGMRPAVDQLFHQIDGLFGHATLGAALLAGRAFATAGNLVFARSLFDDVGGFKPLSDGWDWAFALDALKFGEPCFVDEPLYFARVDGDRASGHGLERDSRERDRVRVAWHRALGQEPAARRPSLAMALAERRAADRQMMAQGRGAELGAATLLMHAAELGLAAFPS